MVVGELTHLIEVLAMLLLAVDTIDDLVGLVHDALSQ